MTGGFNITIDRCYETMTSKERVLRTFNHEKPDRVPINYHSNPGVDTRLKACLGIGADDTIGLFDALGVDFRGVGAPYTGKALHTSDRADRIVDPLHGWVLRYIQHGSGGYWDYCDFPLIDAGEEEVSRWAFPNPDDFDYNVLADQVRHNKDYAVFAGNAGLGCVINNMGFLRGMEQVFVDLVSDDPAGLLLIKKFIDYQFEVYERTMNKIGRDIDFVWIGEDLGAQYSPLISRSIFHRHILPVHKRFIDLAASYGKPVMMHTCGSSSWAYEDYITAGLRGVDTLQPEAKDMSPEYLKKTFGGRLFFHGCISTAGPIAFGTADETAAYCRKTLEIMMPGSGYCFAPTHSLQDNSPEENVIAAYVTAHTAGRYR
ncbi:MAG: uroporphyrinogen decarboxylase family protein [Eubacteriales bacterium]|nr:uroporphyrinogen decarboxylase family protein [Eubacteriales bacterium]